MGERPEYKDLYKAIDEILWNDWDPLGVNDIEEARDEYRSYALQICGLKINGADQDIIAQKLFDFAINEMGLYGRSMEKCRQVAGEIINLED